MTYGYIFGPTSTGSGCPALWSQLYPYNGSANWGNGIQLVQNDTASNPVIAAGANILGNPFMSEAQRNGAMLEVFGQAAASQMRQTYGDDFIDPMDPEYSKKVGEKLTRAGLEASLPEMTQGIDSTISQLEALKKNPDASEEEKEKLQEEIDKLKDLKEQVKELQEELKKPDADVDAIKEKADELKKEIKDNNKELETLVKDICKNIQERKAEAAQNGESDDSEGSGSGASNSGRTSGSSNGSTPALREMTSAEKSNVIKTMNTIREAIYGAGTNYSDDDNGLYQTFYDDSRVNANNIIELIDKWNNTIGKNESHFADHDPLGMIESIMEDCEGKQKVEIGTRIIDLLTDRAEADGILDKVEGEIMEAKASLSPNFLWWRSSKKIALAINKLVTKIKNLEKDMKTEEAQKKDDAKKEADAVKAKIVDDAKAEFFQDWKDATGQDITALPSKIKVEIEGKKTVFKCRVNGKDYKASSYAELEKKLKRDGVDIKTLS